MNKTFNRKETFEDAAKHYAPGNRLPGIYISS